ncbi:hypothetical protein OUZ56_010407 [Daphnia magna]|uniref:Uncharacterized protein n=1 Tax=Daphnia magna TaxID=35525 RepID=A0ABR0AIG1_9CRUS|nr:hypothetical protein OUZ56_010407 [Daphnia magna]
MFFLIYQFMASLFDTIQEDPCEPDPTAAKETEKTSKAADQDGSVKINTRSLEASGLDWQKTWKPCCLMAFIPILNFIVIMTAIWVPQQSCCPCSENTTLIDEIPEPQEEIRGEKYRFWIW